MIPVRMSGHETDHSGTRVQDRRPAEYRHPRGDHRRRVIVAATDGRFYTLDATTFPAAGAMASRSG